MSDGDDRFRSRPEPLRFLYEPEPVRGEIVQVGLDVWRAVAANPSKMTYHGTNTYFLDNAPKGCSCSIRVRGRTRTT